MNEEDNRLFYKDLKDISNDLELIFNKISLTKKNVDNFLSLTIMGTTIPYSKFEKYINNFNENNHCKAISLNININDKRYEFLLNSTFYKFNFYFYENGTMQGEQPFNNKSSFQQSVNFKGNEYTVNLIVSYFVKMFSTFLLEYSKYIKIQDF